MAEPSYPPLPASSGGQPGDLPAGAGIRVPVAALVVAAAAIVGTAVLGVGAGFLWMALAPRALLVVVAPGSANVVNPETSAFIAADGWFILLSVLGGLVSGLAGYVLAVRRYREPAMAGVLVGGLAAALVAMWIGERSGRAAFSHGLAAGRPGSLLRAPLVLGGHGALAFWPLAAGLTAGGIEAVILLRERWREADLQQAQALALGSPAPGAPAPRSPGPKSPAQELPAPGAPVPEPPAARLPAPERPAESGLAALAEPHEPGPGTESGDQPAGRG
jgi:hypothetical protein